MKALGLVVSQKKIFLCFTHDPTGAGPLWTPGARLAEFIKRTTIHCYTQNMKALGLVVSEKIFLCFTHDPPVAGPVWTPGAGLAEFIKRTTIHCYTQNMKALGLVVSEKKIILCFTHDPPGAGPVRTLGARLAGFINKEDNYTLLLTKYESSGPCGFGDFLCFSHCKSMGANDPPGYPFLTPGA